MVPDVWTKEAADAASDPRLRREADLLHAARHPGVVELVGVGGEPGRPVLATKRVDGLSLDRVSGLPLEEVAGLLAGVAATVADLHDVGVVHGAICPSHVLLDRHGHAVLCGFGYGARIGEAAVASPPIPAEFIDPSAGSAPVLHPAYDVFALGALARHLVANSPGVAAGGQPRETLEQALTGLAEWATGPVPSRPTARAVAAAVFDTVPGARIPRLPGDTPPAATSERPLADDPLEDWRRQLTLPQRQGLRYRRRYGWNGRPMSIAIAVATAASLAVGAALVTRSDQAPAGSGRLEAATHAPVVESPDTPERLVTTSTTAVRARRSPAPRRAPMPGNCTPPTAALSADIDGDGCREELTFSDGVLTGGGRRWEVGEAGDHVAVGDWACAGTETLALLRPGTGAIYRFDGWPPAGAALTAPLLAAVEGAVAVRAADLDADGCHELVVDLRDGGRRVVAVPTGPP